MNIGDLPRLYALVNSFSQRSSHREGNGLRCGGWRGAGLLVQFDPQAGFRGELEFAPVARVPAVDEVAPPRHVVLGKVLLDKDAGRRPAEVHGSTKGDRPNRQCGANRRSLGLLHQHGDFFADRQAAAMGTDRAARCRRP